MSSSNLVNTAYMGSYTLAGRGREGRCSSVCHEHIYLIVNHICFYTLKKECFTMSVNVDGV